MKNLSTFLTAILLISSSQCANWAVIVAGSKGYYNYRHQADVCHAYQILIKGGIPKENIILFSHDDAAEHKKNPFPGKLFNKPDGTDVYTGCVIDYRKRDVTPENYLAVIQGQKDKVQGGTGRVLQSTENDLVFLNFADHGAPGLVAFPHGKLKAPDLLAALSYMHQNKMYSKLVYYMEACESGSMFKKLPTDINVYAVTAADPDESSLACYCPPEDIVQGKKIHACLGDVFSVNWMEDSDVADRKTETLEQQYDKVRVKTKTSHVKQYGDLSFVSESIGDFIGNGSGSGKSGRGVLPEETKMVDSRDVKLIYLISLHAEEQSEESMRELNKEILMRKHYDDLFEKIGVLYQGVADDTDFACYSELIEHFESFCGETTDYGYKYYRAMYDICQLRRDLVPKVKEIMLNECLVW